MKITVLCSSFEHPINPWLEAWIADASPNNDIAFCRDVSELPGGDILFLISCHQLVSRHYREKYNNTLVLHASNLPKGRGWSPYIWELLEGETSITVSMLEAEDGVDTGAIWARRTFDVPEHALVDEINASLFSTELQLMDEALLLYPTLHKPEVQSEIDATYYRRRTPEDSEIDPEKSIAEQFNKIRLMDPVRYPAYFSMYGHKYLITLQKVSDEII